MIQKLKPSSEIWPELEQESVVSKIKSLDISGNALKMIPVQVYQLSNVKTLLANGCSIQYTNSLEALTKLTKLGLDHNILEDDKIGPLPESLITLNLSFNHLNNFPAALHCLVNLISLQLSSNRIESLYGIDMLVSLEEVNLDDNLLEELPESICALTKLKKISLLRNRFTKTAVTREGQSIPAGLLENSAVDHIDLMGNVGITRADVMAFKGIDKFLERRQALKEKNFSGGALIETTLFGLD